MCPGKDWSFSNLKKAKEDSTMGCPHHGVVVRGRLIALWEAACTLIIINSMCLEVARWVIINNSSVDSYAGLSCSGFQYRTMLYRWIGVYGDWADAIVIVLCKALPKRNECPIRSYVMWRKSSVVSKGSGCWLEKRDCVSLFLYNMLLLVPVMCCVTMCVYTYLMLQQNTMKI